MINSKTTQEIVDGFIDYHRKNGYEIFESFPMITDDPTVMFVNATITPFKGRYINSGELPRNFALIQKCFRLGNSNEIDSIRTNPFFLTFFEMCGSGMFGVNHDEAVGHVLDLLETFGLCRRELLFTVPDDQEFENALLSNGIDKTKIFTIIENGLFWQSWKFGRMGPVGRGLTAVYSKTTGEISLEEMTSKPNLFIDLLNIIHVYGRETENGQIVPITHPGFELGMGLERLIAIMQNTDSYGIDSVKPLVEKVFTFTESRGLNIDMATARVLTNHLRSICVLIDEKVVPSNKKHGYVLRRIIRHFLETTWDNAGCVVPVKELLEAFVAELHSCGLVIKVSISSILDVIEKEAEALQKAMKAAKTVMRRQPNITAEVLKDTYGLSPILLRIAKGGSHESD